MGYVTFLIGNTRWLRAVDGFDHDGDGELHHLHPGCEERTPLPRRIPVTTATSAQPLRDLGGWLRAGVLQLAGAKHLTIERGSSLVTGLTLIPVGGYTARCRSRVWP